MIPPSAEAIILKRIHTKCETNSPMGVSAALQWMKSADEALSADP
jgi:hypothetical protein